MDHAEIARILSTALGAAADPPSFLPLIDGIRDALRAGDRSHKPVSVNSGLYLPPFELTLTAC